MKLVYTLHYWDGLIIFVGEDEHEKYWLCELASTEWEDLYPETPEGRIYRCVSIAPTGACLLKTTTESEIIR